MISLDVIRTIANKQQTTELNVRREYVQHVFLSYFYQHPSTDSIYFKGGTALRIVFNSPRFSEDLDFSSSSTKIKPIEDAVVDTLKEVEREKIGTEVKESKLTSGGYLSVIDFDLGEQTISLQLEVLFRDGKKNGEFSTIVNDFIRPYPLMVLMKEQLIAEKVRALLNRKKPRDFYDLYFIMRANLLTPQERTILPEVLEILEKTKLDFERELKQFLPKNQWIIIRTFKTVFKRELQKYI